jgi:nuclear pore complex protein Nup62
MAVCTTVSTDDKSKAAGTSSALTITVQPPSMLRGKTIEEIVNKWSSDLEAQVKEFSKFATEVAVWDRSLIENGNSVSSPSDGLSQQT